MRYKRFSRAVWTFSIPKSWAVFDGKGDFQQPQAFAPTENRQTLKKNQVVLVGEIATRPEHPNSADRDDNIPWRGRLRALHAHVGKACTGQRGDHTLGSSRGEDVDWHA